MAENKSLFMAINSFFIDFMILYHNLCSNYHNIVHFKKIPNCCKTHTLSYLTIGQNDYLTCCVVTIGPNWVMYMLQYSDR